MKLLRLSPPPTTMPVSVIIPTLNEAGFLTATLRCLRTQKPYEILVVDGGSTDGTCQEAALADRLLHAPRGRAVQMNQGAAAAAGDVLLFLHADCTLQAGALEAAERTLGRARVVGGCFRMHVAAEAWVYRLIDACATARVRLTGLVYGDQGLFVRRDVFARLGGFPALRLMEDIFFSRALRRLGRVIVLSQQIGVSPRRWQRQGILRQTLRNWLLTALAAGGVNPDRLAAFYPAIR
jgi:rSAM/selenodomain-associated transferase 2